MAESEANFPEELQERLSAFDDSLSNFEEVLKSLHETPINQLQENMNALDKAKVELLGVYALNSLYWMYLNVKGENPKEHSIRQELERVRNYMKRVKDIQDKEKMSRINKDASKRFVRSALWQQAQKKAKEDPPQKDSPVPAPGPSSKQQPSSSKQSSSRGRYHYQKPKRLNDRKFAI